MTAVFQPPPTWANPVLVDERTGEGRFNPIWLKWFLDLVELINTSGAGSGVIQHNSTGSLQGGQLTQFYHLTSTEYTGVGTGAFVRAVGTAPSLVAGTVTTNANLTGPITSTGNATAVASQTGTGTKFVMDTSPALITPNIGVAAGTSLNLTGGATVVGGAQFITTNTALTNGAGVGAGTLATAPAAGNPTKWIGVNDNGTIRYVPAW